MKHLIARANKPDSMVDAVVICKNHQLKQIMNADGYKMNSIDSYTMNGTDLN